VSFSHIDAELCNDEISLIFVGWFDNMDKEKRMKSLLEMNIEKNGLISSIDKDHAGHLERVMSDSRVILLVRYPRVQPYSG
jgi:hypothetical protein